MLMRAGIFKVGLIWWLVAALMFTVTAGSVQAAEPTLYELPKATHAHSLSVGDDGTLWWAPGRGSEYQGSRDSVLGEISAGGTVGEKTVAGLGTITATAIAPDGRLWLAARHRVAPGVIVLEVGRASPLGELEEQFAVGRGRGWIGSLSATTNAVWFIAHPRGGAERIERVSASNGSVRRFTLGRDCKSEALAPAGRTVWFTEACDHQGRKGRSTRSSIGRIDSAGRVIRYRIAKRDYPVSLAIATNRVVWFGARSWDYASTPRVGRVTRSGGVVEYAIPGGEPSWIAVGGENRLWFPSSRGGDRSPYLASIGVGGDLGKPICGEPTCYFEPTELTAAPDGGLWYTLHKPFPLEAGGGALISWPEETANEAGLIAHWAP